MRRRETIASKLPRLPIKWVADGYVPEEEDCKCIDVIFIQASHHSKTRCNRCGENSLVHSASDGNYYCDACRDDLVVAGAAEMV